MKSRDIRMALVVDDNLRWLETLRRLARSQRYDVLTARSYHQAQQQAAKYHHPLDLVITDIRLEDNDASNIDGIRLLKDLHGSGQVTASIVVTGYPSEESRQLSESVGALYLVKGRFTRKDFADVEQQIRQRRETTSHNLKVSETAYLLLHWVFLFFEHNRAAVPRLQS